MKIYMKILFFLLEYLNFISGVTSLNNSCIFGVKSVSMILYNSTNPYGKENISVPEVCDIDTSKRVVFLVHGFGSTANESYLYSLTQQFLKEDYTVFSLDWDDAACKNRIPLLIGLRTLEYRSAAANTRKVGEYMARYIIELTKCAVPVPLANILLIGHSLGAHVCGFAGKTTQAKFKATLSRCIGADPAGPLFTGNECSQRLCKSDCDTVIVIHTSVVGIPEPIGYFDFDVNFAVVQPGCGFNQTSVNDIVSCSHVRSVDYLTYILEYDCGYPGYPTGTTLSPKSSGSDTTKCIFLDSTIFNKNYFKEGVYSVCTDSKFPYCTNNTCICH